MDRLVLFDADGTLTRTRNGYLTFSEAIWKTFGVAGDIRSVIPDGNTDPLIVEEIFAAGLDNFLSRGAYASDSRHRVDLPRIAKARWEQTRERSIRSEQRIVVGDAPKDLEAARKNRIKYILVGTGRYPVEELGCYGRDACPPDLSDGGAVVDLLRHLS